MKAFLKDRGGSQAKEVEIPRMNPDVFAMLKAADPNTVLAIEKINGHTAGVCWHEKDGVERGQVLISDLSIYPDGKDYKEA